RGGQGEQVGRAGLVVAAAALLGDRERAEGDGLEAAVAQRAGEGHGAVELLAGERVAPLVDEREAADRARVGGERVVVGRREDGAGERLGVRIAAGPEACA